MQTSAGETTEPKLLYSVDDEPSFKFTTSFRKQFDAPNVLNFKVALQGYSSEDADDTPGPTIAHLTGFLYQPGYIPEGFDDGYFDVFDMRSGHAAEAYHLLANESSLIDAALDKDGVSLEELWSVAYFERAWVHPGLRGKNVALRMFREAKPVLSRAGLVVLAKAFPDNNGTPAKCNKLADYYRSDARLGLRVISRKKHPGWLVGHWDSPDVYEEDDVVDEVEVERLTVASDPHPE